MICLINPSIQNFELIRKYLFDLIIDEFVKISHIDDWKRSIVAYYATQGIEVTYSGLFNVRDPPELLTNADAIFDDRSLGIYRMKVLTKSPVNINIIPNIMYKEGNTPRQLDMASIQMETATRSHKSELIDITFPSINYKYIDYLWKNIRLTRATIGEYTFNVPTPISLWLEQNMAYALTPDSLADKKTRRGTRRNGIKRFISDKYASGNANIKHTLNSNPNLKSSILS
jgi:hypothetical protein